MVTKKERELYVRGEIQKSLVTQNTAYQCNVMRPLKVIADGNTNSMKIIANTNLFT